MQTKLNNNDNRRQTTEQRRRYHFCTFFGRSSLSAKAMNVKVNLRCMVHYVG